MGNSWRNCKKEISSPRKPSPSVPWLRCKFPLCDTKNRPRVRDWLEWVEKWLPLIGILAVIAVFIVLWWSSFRKAENTEPFSNQPLTLPTDSLAGPRVEIQKQPLQVANGGDQTIWIEWVGSSPPFYPEDYTAEGVEKQNAGFSPSASSGKAGGGRIRIDPGQHVFFPVKKTRLEEKIRLSPLMGCDASAEGCQVGTESVTPYFEFLFSPPKSRAWDSVLISAETGSTLPFNFSYFSGEENAVTTMICSLPPEECPDRFQALNSDENFIGCASASPGEDTFKTLLAQNCLVAQSPSHHLVGSPMFDREDKKYVYIPADKGNRFKLTFYVKGFEWVN